MLTLRLPDNAISRLETRTLQRAAERVPRWHYWLGFAIRYLLLGLSLFYFGGLLIAAITQRDPFPLVSQSPLLTILFSILILLWHFGLMRQTLFYGAVSLAGERESGRWELLLLTGVSAQDLVSGKWAALVRRQFPAYLWLAVFRGGAIAAWALYSSDTIAFSTFYRYHGTAVWYTLPSPLLVILGGVVIFIMTLMNLVFTAGCAVAVSAISRGRIRAILSTIAARLAQTLSLATLHLIVITVLFRMTPDRIYIGGDSFWGTALASTLGSLLDNGLTTATSLMAVTTHYKSINLDKSLTTGMILATLLGSLWTLVLYGLLTRFSLRRAERRLIASGVSPEDS